ncbi:hypothetical protein PENSPDRAFT_647650 [Peniophora sp. CONT]|nr:hypothetical protein PENSPDRAFT_647650 [Peniophora sp. CONT]
MNAREDAGKREFVEEFSRALRSSPTAALDSYRRLYVTRESSNEAKEQFDAATRVIWLSLSYKHWKVEMAVDDRPLRSYPSDRVLDCVKRAEDIGADLWDAMMSSEVPVLWLDIYVEQIRMVEQSPMAVDGNIFICLSSFTFLWSMTIFEGATPDLPRNPSSFTVAFIPKFLDAFSVSWEYRETFLPELALLNVFERLSHDIAYVHAYYRMENQMLLKSKVAHFALWTICKKDRALLVESMVHGRPTFGIEALKAVSMSVRATVGPGGYHAWLSEVANAVGVNDLMDMFRGVILDYSVGDIPLVKYIRALYELAQVPACMTAFMNDPHRLVNQCSEALARLMKVSLEVPLRHRWYYHLEIFTGLYRICVMTNSALGQVPQAHATEIATLLFAYQLSGVTFILDVINQRVNLDPSPRDGATIDTVTEEHADDFYKQTVKLVADIEAAARGNREQGVAFQQAYIEVARVGWIRSVKQLRDTQQKHGNTTIRHLVRTWVALGRYMGMGNAEALLNIDRTCSTNECQYHLVPADKPLLICKGCQQARYCSRECQKIDWKERHRVECRRVKPTGS